MADNQAAALPNINDLQRYAGVNPDGDLVTLGLCMDAAKQWFAGAGVDEPLGGNPLYTLGVYMLATHYYDNRAVLLGGGNLRGDVNVPFGVMSIMHQLRL